MTLTDPLRFRCGFSAVSVRFQCGFGAVSVREMMNSIFGWRCGSECSAPAQRETPDGGGGRTVSERVSLAPEPFRCRYFIPGNDDETDHY